MPLPSHQGFIRREGASEAAPGAVTEAVGGGWGRLLSVTTAIEAGTWHQGDVAGGGVPAALPVHPCLPPPSFCALPLPCLCTSRRCLVVHGCARLASCVRLIRLLCPICLAGFTHSFVWFACPLTLLVTKSDTLKHVIQAVTMHCRSLMLTGVWACTSVPVSPGGGEGCRGRPQADRIVRSVQHRPLRVAWP